MYNGVRVFGRNVTVSANGAGEGDFITSSTVPSSRLAEADLNFAYTKEQAEEAARTYYLGSFDVREGMTEKVIFSLYGYENNPVPAYVVNVYGNKNGDGYIDENVFVNALNGEAIFSTTNIHTAIARRTENDELGNPRTFPVVPEHTENGTVYYMRSPDVNCEVELYNNIHLPPFQATYGNNDLQQISAYVNMIDVMKWWKASFDRNSLDGKGMVVKVVAHQYLFAKYDNDGNFVGIEKNNACWQPYYKAIFVYDHSDEDKRSCAAAIDVMTHESTHAVIQYNIGYDFSVFYACYLSPTGNGLATGAINEGYADIFGCLMTGQWKNGLNVHADGAYERNIANPADSNALQNGKGRGNAPRNLREVYSPTRDLAENGFTSNNDYGGVHQNSSIVSYPAYLMYSNGLTWNELAQLWYKSMRMGYSCVSTFGTVRTCVVRAARKLGMSAEQRENIINAFEDVGITEQPATLKGTVSKYGGGALSGVRVKATPSNSSYSVRNVITDTAGNFSFNVSVSTYTVEVSHDGYVPFIATKNVRTCLHKVCGVSQNPK